MYRKDYIIPDEDGDEDGGEVEEVVKKHAMWKKEKEKRIPF